EDLLKRPREGSNPSLCTVILENNNGRWKQYSGGHYCFRSFLKSAMISSERLPSKGTVIF
ncbi:MAG: hypothetical protein ACK5A2_08015, partial [Bacteroidota bacterium]